MNEKFHLCFIVFLTYSCTGFAQRCIPRNLGHGSVICICNSTYCDSNGNISPLPVGKIRILATSQKGLRFSEKIGVFSNKAGMGSAFKYVINREKIYQKMLGFGGAFTDSAGINIKSLSLPAQKMLLEQYFSESGIQFNMGRVPIASCDFSTRVYSYDDSPSDFELKNFSLAIEDLKYKIPLIKVAQAMASNTIKLFASPWSAPAWMKTSGKMQGPGSLRSGVEYANSYAQYFIKFFEAYEKYNVSYWGLTAQNEPTSGLLPSYPFQTMGFSPVQERDFISSYLGPAIRKSKYRNLKLMILDDSRVAVPFYTDTILGNSTSADFVDGIGVHWYDDWIISASVLSAAHKKFPDKFILATEACAGDKGKKEDRVKLGSWKRAEQYARSLLDDFNNWVVGWVDWNLALNPTGGPNWVNNFVDSPIIVNSTSGEFYKQPTFYILGHFSRFIPVDSVRVETVVQNEPSFMKQACFVAGKKTVFIIANLGNESFKFTIQDSTRNYETTIEEHSIQTYVWWS